jgi:hypothetical protein
MLLLIFETMVARSGMHGDQTDIAAYLASASRKHCFDISMQIRPVPG